MNRENEANSGFLHGVTICEEIGGERRNLNEWGFTTKVCWGEGTGVGKKRRSGAVATVKTETESQEELCSSWRENEKI